MRSISYSLYISLKRPFPLSTAISASSAHIIEVDHSLIQTRPTVSQCLSSQMIPEFTAGRGPIVYGNAPLAPLSFGDKYSNIFGRSDTVHAHLRPSFTARYWVALSPPGPQAEHGYNAMYFPYHTVFSIPCHLGVMYAVGRGVEPSWTEAVEWYRNANARHGDSR